MIPPFNPMGWGVDHIRVPYKTRMRFFRNSDAETEVTWFFTDKPPLPFDTAFYSRLWSNENVAEQWLGETSPFMRENASGHPPGTVPPGPPMGQPEWFLEGFPSPPDPPVELGDNGFPVSPANDFGAFTIGFDFGYES